MLKIRPNSLLLLSLAIATSLPFILRVNVANATPDCSKSYEELNTPEGRYCSGAAYEAADNELNRVYKQVISGLSSNAKKQLTQEELDWIKYRDRKCDAEIPKRGTGYGIFLNQCLEKVTRQRTKELRSRLSTASLPANENKQSSRRIAEGLYKVGWESYIEVKGNRYRTTAEGDNGPWQPISNLKYVSQGVLAFSENKRKFYACDEKIYPYPVQQGDDLTCSPHGWRKAK